ncbi:patatin family protein [Frisingicoccus caecimuris]|uniref:Putative patatin/cPLA2 family phospholipase n=1 Tax=Frisingicoccus caecimuris TaxID=1796636 RepID=A0A4R2LK57_9FIRM|nr:patatin family protein [Frisingicoccus caecimuris]MCR1917654.1 patatin family protein [Frisingicoccus caecimuris]TCO85925.1 putative patatin/cPLA2 family phospholipase [Frisingicoccus caecimuris]HAP20766.1 patatin family protein [Lachnospiraceae bacterium]
MKTGLVLEGGAMRGMYTAGVLDVMMENHVEVDGVIGVSAGAVFGCNYKSKQIGRVIRYNTKYCSDERYVSLKSLIKTGDLYGAEFCYNELPTRLDPFDVKTYQENPVDFYVTCTDVHTGRPVYHLCNRGDAEDIQWMRASASMPLVSRIVSVGGYDLLDGGISDSIPIRWFLKQGYKKNIVVLTQPAGYRKKPTRMIPMFKVFMRKYPEIAKAMKRRHRNYNGSLKAVKKLEERGEVFLLQPSEPITIGRTEKDPEKLKRVYQLGRQDAQRHLQEMKNFLASNI